MNNWLKRLEFFSPHSIRLLFWLGGAFLFLGLFAKLTKDIFEHDDVEKIDRAVLLLMEKLRVTAFNGAAVDLTALGSPTVIFIVTIIGLLFLLLNKDRWGAIYLATGAAGAGIWTSLLKRLITRERPSVIPRLVEVSGFSYPSGHSLAASSVYLLLTFLACRRYHTLNARILLLGCAAMLIGAVCLSRLYLGVHYPSDVASGAFLGAAWTFFITGLFSRNSKRWSTAGNGA